MSLLLTRLLLLACVAGSVLAQGSSARKAFQIGRVEAASSPRIDGILTDSCWETAPTIGELVMVEPWLGRKPTNATIVRVLHDSKNLYFGIWCEQDPGSVRDSQRARDARLDSDDRIELILDPFENRRTGYWFQVGAGGSIGDSLISANGSDFSKQWDAIWQAQSRKTDDGWVCEIAIPFRSLPRKEGATSWGFNLKRQMRDRNEEYQWANLSQSVPFFRVSEFGTMEGLREIEGGVGVEIVPYLGAGLSRLRISSDPASPADGDWDIDPDMGGEIYYRVSPSMTFATTFLTDFAQTESDSRQINLNRFPLFFPEKRDFFLDGESYYSFGSKFAGGTRFLPYFTRRIGLNDGSPVPILWGMKLQGEAGPFEVGLLDVQVDGTATTSEENLAVARVKYELAEQTTVGLISTNGNPTSSGSNRVGGVDFYHRIPDFVGDLDLQIKIDAVGSAGDGEDDNGESFGIDLSARGQEWTVQTGTRWVSDDFSPALGFVSRRGIRQSELEIGYRPRASEGSSIRRYVFEFSGRRAEEWDGSPQEVRAQIDELGWEFQNGDRVALYFSRRFERVSEDFDLFDGSTITSGDYWQTRVGARVTTSKGRPVSGGLRVFTGDFFDGRSTSIYSDLDWRVSPLLQFGIDYNSTIADLGAAGEFTTHIGSSTIDLFFSPELSLRNLAQYDNDSDSIGWQSRLRWIYSPGCDFYLVFGSNWLRTEDESIVPTEQALNLKIAHTVRF